MIALIRELVNILLPVTLNLQNNQPEPSTTQPIDIEINTPRG